MNACATCIGHGDKNPQSVSLRLLLVAFVCATWLVMGAVHAASWNGGGDIFVPQDYPTINEALDEAWDGATIVVAPGIYNEAVNVYGEVSLISSGGPEATIIDATGFEAPAMSLWFMDGGLIDGFTIRGGSHLSGLGWGGGITCDFSFATIANCIITQNIAESGGGVAVINNSTLTFENCTIVGNSAGSAKWGGNGGGAYINSATAVFENCTFDSNIAADGGGGGVEINWQGNATFIDCTFVDNSAPTGSGGAVQMLAVGTFMNCTFQSNTAVAGGAVSTFGTVNASFSDCVFENNAATGLSVVGGGAFLAETGGTVSLSNCTFSDNQATTGGAAQFFFFNGNASINGCEFNANIASDSGGGLAIWGTTGATVTGTVFDGNTSPAGGGVFVNSSTVPFESCIFRDNTTGSGGNGGGLNANANANVTLRNCTVNNNFSQFGGGIYLASSSNVALIGCLIRNNSTNFAGAGAYVSTFGDPLLTARSTVFCENPPSHISGPWTNLGGTSLLSSCGMLPPNDSPDSPQPLPGGGSYSGTFYGAVNSGSSTCDPDGVDVFYEYEVIGGPVTLEIDTCDSDVDTALAVFDSKGKELACSTECDGDPCDGPPAACLVLDDLADGVYLIRVSQPVGVMLGSGSAPGAGAFVLNIVEIDVPNCGLGDINCDDVVNVSDLLLLFGAWGDCPHDGSCPADLNGDGVVNVSDLLILFANWG